MTFACVLDGVVQVEQDRLPESAGVRLQPRTWITGLASLAPSVWAICGWFEVAPAERPADTATDTSDRSLVWTGSGVQEVWTIRPKTQAELDVEKRALNEVALTVDTITAIDALLATVAALNAITDLTNAEINANPAAVIKDCARECKTIARQALRLARLVTGSTLSTDTGS